MLGCGTVGGEVVRLLREQAADLAARVGAPVELVGVAVRRPHRHPELGDLLTTDASALVTRPDVDVVVEVIGGIEPVRTWLLEALKAGKSVVTANKALLAEDGATLAEAADSSGADLYYEASVAGAIPLLRPLRESLAGDRITRVAGIVNGTTNFILSSMAASGASYADALDEATRLGYAEADPSADVDGYDAASKAAILASLAFHTRVTAADVHCEGIRDVTAVDIAAARRLGCVIKLLAICERTERPGIGLGAGLSGDDPGRAPAGRGRRGVQRRVRRGRGGGPADVLRPGRRRGAHRERGARRPRRGGAQPCRRRPRPAREHLRQPADAADGQRADPLPRQPGRRRPRRRARDDLGRVRGTGCEHRGRAPDRRGRHGADGSPQARSRPGWWWSRTSRRRPRWPPPSASWPGWTS